MIVRLAGLAIDARYALPSLAESAARAAAARWIAANALAASGVRVSLDGAPPREPRVFALHAPCFAGVLAALAALPALFDPATLPRGWRLALRALGVPGLDRSSAVALAQGVSVLGCGAGSCDLSVELETHGYRVRVGMPGRLLVA